MIGSKSKKQDRSTVSNTLHLDLAVSSTTVAGLRLLPENWVRLLLGVKPKDTTKPKSGGRKDLLLAASKENTGDLFQRNIAGF